MNDLIELIAAFLYGILKLVFAAYILLLIIVFGAGIIGITSITYFLSELCMLVIGYIIYRSRREAYGASTFPFVWASCSLVDFWPLMIFGKPGIIFSVIVRFFFLVVCHR